MSNQATLRLLMPLLALAIFAGSSARAEPVCNGATDDARCVIEVMGVEVSALRSAFTSTSDASGFEIHGTVRIGDSDNSVKLFKTDLVAEYADPTDPGAGYRRLFGQANLSNRSITDAGDSAFGAAFVTDKTRRVDVGLELGSILAGDPDNPVPHLNPARPCNGRTVEDADFQECPYLILRYLTEESTSASIGGTDIGFTATGTTEQNAGAILVVDPQDIFAYVGFNPAPVEGAGSATLKLESTSADGEEEEDLLQYKRGIGFSQQGRIPFEVRTDWGIEKEVEMLGLDFEGHLVVDWADIPLGNLPASMDASMVIKLPIDEVTGKARFDAHYQAAANGVVTLGVPLFEDVLDFSMKIGDATIGQQLTVERQVYFGSGILDSSFPWEPGALPLAIDYRNEYRAAYVLINNVDPYTAVPFLDLSDSFVQIEGHYLFDLSIGGRHGKLGGALEANGFLRMHATDGIDFTGNIAREATADLIHPKLQVATDVRARLHFDPYDVNATVAELTGEFAVADSTYVQQGTLKVTTRDAYLGFPARFDLNSITAAYSAIQDQVQAARRETETLADALAAQRAIVQAERDAAERALESALGKLQGAQAEVASLKAGISAHYSRIASNNRSIAYYKGRCTSASWYNKASRCATYAAKRAYYTARNAAEYAAIAAKEASLLIANTALEIAMAAVAAAEAAVVTTPIDLDPRVAPVLASYLVAKASLDALLKLMPEIPSIPGELKATFGFRLAGARLTPETRAEYCEGDSCVTLKAGSYDQRTGLACVNLPGLGNARVCALVPKV